MCEDHAINGSPREDGNTFQYLNMVLEEAKIRGGNGTGNYGQGVKGCRGCYHRVQAKKCTQVDDFQSIFLKIVRPTPSSWARRYTIPLSPQS